MTIFRSVYLYITLLSIFLTQQVDEVYSSDPIIIDQTNPDSSDRYEKGVGPQVNMTLGGATSLPHSYFWRSGFRLNNHPEGIPVYRPFRNTSSYTVYQNRPRLRGFIIRDNHNLTVLTADDTSKAKCHHRHTYVASPNVNYTIHPRGAKTDRWYMSVLGPDGNLIELVYYRGEVSNEGNVKFYNDTTVATLTTFLPSATIMASVLGNTTYDGFVMRLTVLPESPLDASYYIGLWNLVKKRISRCGY